VTPYRAGVNTATRGDGHRERREASKRVERKGGGNQREALEANLKLCETVSVLSPLGFGKYLSVETAAAQLINHCLRLDGCK
jgi:hypothetical protein